MNQSQVQEIRRHLVGDTNCVGRQPPQLREVTRPEISEPLRLARVTPSADRPELIPCPSGMLATALPEGLEFTCTEHLEDGWPGSARRASIPNAACPR